jgi:2-polyprenyl-3-methyl-5-hydroxy-6-metoxy-1,4-benzoquinol methylase
MINKNCPICNTDKHSKIVYQANLEINCNNINFSGRKKPDGLHYEMVRCKKCTLLYASQIYDNVITEKLYTESKFEYKTELEGLKKTYGNCLAEAEKLLKNKKNFLEIGCGNGFILEIANENGWENILGVEPSLIAIQNANSKIKNKILNGIFDVNNYENNYFDIVFVAMLIEHVPDINKFLSDIYKILKPEGILVTICHNERHFLSKILKNKHPIINDEHNYVFSPNTLKKIYKKIKFYKLIINNLKNYYPIEYWIKMLPFNKKLINFINKFFSYKILKKNVGLKAGNIFLIASK